MTMCDKLSEACPFCIGNGCNKCNGTGKRKDIDYFEYLNNTHPICPHCGKEDIDFIVDGPDMKDEEEDTNECPYCGCKYKISCHIEITYDTEVIQ